LSTKRQNKLEAWSDILGQGPYWQISAKAGISYGKRLSSLPATPGTKKK